jgi:hypothetical protein
MADDSIDEGLNFEGSWRDDLSLPIKVGISIAAVVLIALRIHNKDFIDATSLGIFGLGSLPWIISDIRTVKLPGGIEITIKTLEDKVKDNASKIESQQEIINKLVKYSMSASIYKPLWYICKGQQYIYHHNPTNERELYFLRDAGYIEPRSGGFLVFDQKINGRNLSDIAKCTPIGEICVQLRGDP